jgi:cell division FtsZ-interacting protein ZapD
MLREDRETLHAYKTDLAEELERQQQTITFWPRIADVAKTFAGNRETPSISVTLNTATKALPLPSPLASSAGG